MDHSKTDHSSHKGSNPVQTLSDIDYLVHMILSSGSNRYDNMLIQYKKSSNVTLM